MRSSPPFSTLFFLCCLLSLLLFGAKPTAADWWDDLKKSVSEKLNDGADFAQNVAAPAISDTWESAKTAVVESDAHKWVRDSAIPAIKTGFDDVKGFIHEKTAPDGTAAQDETTTAGAASMSGSAEEE